MIRSLQVLFNLLGLAEKPTKTFSTVLPDATANGF